MDMETVRDTFDPLSLELRNAEEGQECGHADEAGTFGAIKCSLQADFMLHFHVDLSPFSTECITLPGCREHVIPVWEALWLRTPDAN